MRHSLYWDNFAQRIDETVDSVINNRPTPIKRVAVFITDKCNLKCKYCSHQRGRNEISLLKFDSIVKTHSDAIIHITGGEPSVVPWLYEYLMDHEGAFHLNTNLVKPAPYESIKRLKVSLDHWDKDSWESLVQRTVFNRVVNNIKEASLKTVTSITCTVSRQNFDVLPQFAKFCRDEFPELYAIFFSIYKGDDPGFVLSEYEVDLLFNEIFPRTKDFLNTESIHLLNETIDEKRRLLQGIRFPENNNIPCYISMSEKVYDWDGESSCSHLYRDGIKSTPMMKHKKCLYGCNRRLIMFNQEVHRILQDKGIVTKEKTLDEKISEFLSEDRSPGDIRLTPQDITTIVKRFTNARDYVNDPLITSNEDHITNLKEILS